MKDHHLNVALAYYQAMTEKNITKLEQYLDSNVRLVSPLAIVTGKTAAMEAATGFMKAFNTLKIRASFSQDNQVMIAMDIDFPEPIGSLRAAVLMTFKDKLIIENEMFYDACPFLKIRNEIFASEEK